jgi:hypothetical protein
MCHASAGGWPRGRQIYGPRVRPGVAAPRLSTFVGGVEPTNVTHIFVSAKSLMNVVYIHRYQ